MLKRNTAIIIVTFGVLSAIVVLFFIGVYRVTDPDPNREIRLQTQSFINRSEDVKPQYDANNTAIVTLKVNQKSEIIILRELTWFHEAKIDVLQNNNFKGRVVPVVMQIADTTGSCDFGSIRLLNMTSDTATFRFVKSGQCIPY